MALLLLSLAAGQLAAQSPSAEKAQSRARTAKPGVPDARPLPGDSDTGSSAGYHNRDETPESTKAVDFADTVEREALKDRKRRQ